MGAGAKAWGWDPVNKVWVPIQGNADGALILAGCEGGVAGEGHITILGPSYDSIGQGDWGISPNTDQYLNGWVYCIPSSDGDNLSYKIYLDAGIYTLLLYTILDSNKGIIDIDIDNTEVASFDLYSPWYAPNIKKLQTGIVIATAGLKTLKCRVDGCNPLAVGFDAPISYIALWRTA